MVAFRFLKGRLAFFIDDLLLNVMTWAKVLLRLGELMEIGFNSNVVIKGEAYHIQSEDWGESRAFLVSQIFKSGAIVKTIKVSYLEAFAKCFPGVVHYETELLKKALKHQHSEILKKLMVGRL